MNKCRLIVVVGLVVLVSAVTALAAAPSGDQQAIKLARAQVRAYSRIPALSFTRIGFAAMRDAEGSTSFFDWTWGQGVVPHGWAKATEHALLGVLGGRVAWWRDDLTPAPCTAPGFCFRIPVELAGERSGQFVAFGSASNHTCFSPLNGSTPIQVGARVDTVGGRFSAPVRRGGSVRLTYVFPWRGLATQPATETDMLSARTLLDQSGRIRVARGPGRGRPAFTVSYSESYPAQAVPPQINRCKR